MCFYFFCHFVRVQSLSKFNHSLLLLMAAELMRKSYNLYDNYFLKNTSRQIWIHLWFISFVFFLVKLLGVLPTVGLLYSFIL